MVGSAVYQGADRVGAHDASLCGASWNYFYLGKLSLSFFGGRGENVANEFWINQRVSR